MPSRYKLGSADTTVELTLPSHEDPNDPNSPHNVCLVRPLNPAMLLESGLLDQLDSLTALVASEHIAPKQGAKVAAVQAAAAARKARKNAKAVPGLPGDDAEVVEGIAALKQFAENKGDMQAVFTLMDKIVEMAVVEPSVIRPVLRNEDGSLKLNDIGEEQQLPYPARVKGQVYTDSIDTADKVEVVQFAMGGVKGLEQFRQERS